jgi:hypothetical protein
VELFNPLVQEAAYNEISSKQKFRERVQKTIRPEVAAAVSNIYQRGQYIKPSTALSLAKANASDQAVDLANNISARSQLTEQEDAKGFIQRFFYEPVKKASRYINATLNLTPELIQNIASKTVNPDPSMSGIFKSTTLGSLLADPDAQGEGFFVSDDIAKAQSERARKFRGVMEDGKAFTIGRASASLLLPEKSLAYRLLSGAVDAAIQFVDPTIALGKVAKTARLTGQIGGVRIASGALIPDTTAVLAHIDELEKAGDVVRANAAKQALRETLDSAEEAAQLGAQAPKVFSPTRTVQRSGELAEAGVISQAREALDASDFGKWWGTNRGARRLEKAANKLVAEYTDDSIRLRNNLADAQQELDTLYNAARRPGAITAMFPNVINADEARKAWRESIKATKKQVDELTETIEVRRNYHAFRIQDEIFEGKITGQQALKLLDTAENGGVQRVFAEAAAKLRTTTDQRPGQFVEDIRDLAAARAKPLSQLANATYMRIPQVNKFVRKWGSAVPDNVMLVKGNPEQRYDAVLNIKNFMNTLGSKVPADVRAYVIGKTAKAFNTGTGSPTGVYEARNVIKEAVAEVLRHNYDVPEKAIAKLIEQQDQAVAKMRQRIATEIGKNPGHNLVRTLIDNYGVDEANLIKTLAGAGVNVNSVDDLNGKILSPTIFSELLNNVVVLPDVRKMRALATNPFWRKTVQRATKTGDGEQRAILDAVEFFQNEIWKPFTLMNPGYFLRNIFDGQMHIYLENDGSLASMLNKPFAYFSWVLGKRGGAGIAGEAFTPAAREALERYGDELLPAEEAFFRAQQNKAMKHVGDPVDAMERMIMSGEYGFTTRVDNPQLHTMGILDQLRMLNKDPLVRRAMAREGTTKNVDELMEYLETVPDVKESLLDLARSGFVYGVENGRATRIKLPPTLSDDPDELLRVLIQTEVFGRVDKWYNVPELRVIAANNRVPIIEPGNQRAIVEDFVKGFDVADADVYYVEGKQGVGTVFRGKGQYADRDFVVIDVQRKRVPVDEINNPGQTVVRDVWKAIPVYPLESTTLKPGVLDKGRAFMKTPLTPGQKGKMYDDELMRVVDTIYNSADNANNELIPAVTGFAMRHKEDPAKYTEKWLGKWREFSDFFFNGLVGAGTNYLEKSPIWQQYYYRNVRENAELLSKTEFNRLIANIRRDAEKVGMTPNQFIGGGRGSKLFDELVALEPKAKGVGTVEQLSEFAGNRATSRMKDVLYDAAKRSNAEDVLRVMAPFAAAWREVLTKYVTQFADDPANYRRVQRAFVGMTNMDLEGDGTGFFYKDPQSGQFVFNYPLSDKASQLFTGLTAPLAAPVKGLSMGFQFNPSLGPVAQIATNAMFKFVPKENDFRKFLLPYGSPGTSILDFTPGYMRKMISALKADPSQLDGVFGQTYVETVRALQASGNYDLSDTEQREALFDDAVGKARILTIFRALNQFVGPASGATKFEIDTKEGDVYMSQLIKAFQDMQEKDYESAVPDFLETFGDDMLLYVSGKSKSLVGGVQPTEKFEAWARDNEKIMKRYEGVAGFFAPGQDDFSFTAWKAQVDRGQRERLTAEQVVEQAELMVGSSLFRRQRLKFGAYPNAAQQEWLREYRKALHAKYPGFPEMPSFDPSVFPTLIGNLKAIVEEPSLQNNDIVKATKLYLNKRDQMLALAGEAGLASLKSKQVEPLRNYLASVADVLIEKYPDFKRLFEQELQAELLQYDEQ